MKIKLYIFIPFFLTLNFELQTLNSYSQHYSFENYTTKHGLPQNQIYSMCQDSKGYIWFGTNGRGVARYDGYDFQTFTTKDGLIDNLIRVIIEDSKGSLWFGTDNGISKLPIHSYEHHEIIFKNYTTKDGLSNNTVQAIIEDDKGIIWIGTDGGLSRIESAKNDTSEITFKNYTISDGLFNNMVVSIMQDDNKNLWIGYDGGGLSVLKFQDEGHYLFSIKHYDIYEKIGNYRIRAILEDNDKNIWVALDDGGGIVIFNPDDPEGGNYKTINAYNGLPSDDIWKLIIDKNGNIWAGTFGGGISKISLSLNDNFTYQVENFSVNDGLAHNVVMSILEDDEGNLWFGTYGGGVSKLLNETYKLHTTKNGLLDVFIWSVFEDSYGNIWAGTNSGGVSVSSLVNKGKSEKRWLSMHKKDGLVNNTVYSVYEDAESNIWIGTEEGISIVKFDDKKKRFRRIRNINSKDGLTDEFVRCIYEDKSGNIWIGTENGGVFILMKNKIIKGKHEPRFYRGKFENINTDSGLINNKVYSILEDGKGSIWLATAGGVSRLQIVDSRTKIENYTTKEGLVNNDVRTVLEDKEGVIWFGTGGGISNYDPKTKTFENLTSKDGLSSDRLYLMHIDRNDSILWIGTNLGIDKFDLAEYRSSGKKIFKHLTHIDNFIESETNTNAVCQDKDNNLWFGTVDGLIYYYPDYKKPKNTVEPKTHIIKISVNKKDTILPSNAILRYNLNSLAFHYIGISLTMPEKVRYQYKLEGFDEKWAPISKEKYTMYSNLPHGEYTFMVKACNNDGVWNREPSTFSFTITPAFWQTWWFYTICFLFTVSSAVLLIKTREKSLKKERKVLEGKVDLRTKQLREEKEKTEQAKRDIEEKNKKLWQVNLAINKEKEKVERIKELLVEKNKDITDSIRYAKDIQHAILPPIEDIRKTLPESFILFKPKDIVSGDFYFYAKMKHTIIIAACDCTGHGVPGAFMSMIGSQLLNEIVNDRPFTNAATVLNQLRDGIIHAFRKAGDTGEQKNGMDIALCAFTRHASQSSQTNSVVNIQYAGAHNPLYIVRNSRGVEIAHSIKKRAEDVSKTFESSRLEHIKADKQPIGYLEGKEIPFTNHNIQLKQGDTIYIFSDGYQDQFGGPRGKKFMSKRFRQLFLDIQEMSMEEQEKHLDKTIEDWKGDEKQVDDILVIGVRVA